jgi:lipopolysaccharide export LptBFGC system permease protein LptF
VEAAERDDRALLDLIDRMEAKGRRADFERMTLYKRSALPLSVPLLTLLGLPLGARRARPALVAAGTVLGWWVLMRLSDQSVSTVGALLASGIPPTALAIAALVGWSRWGAR